ncbi:MAG: glycosyltransferase family 4 protein [Acidobacteria bacterium]|nr:glycosyltransferase family 4 protein [Acidobacteriota bacterium]
MTNQESSLLSLRGHKVGIVAMRALSDPTGIGEYTRNLLPALQSRVEDLWVIGNATPSPPVGQRLISLPQHLRAGYRNKLLAPRRLRQCKFSLLHFMTESELYLLRPGRAKIVVTIHGCASTTLPPELHQQLPRHALLKYRYWLKRVDAIITVSEASKRDIVELFRVPPEKVTAIYNGIAQSFRQRAFDQEQPKRTTGERPFLLSVGATIPKKNIVGILEALAMLKSFRMPHRLIHVGPRDWGYSAIRHQVELLGLQQDVEFKGLVSTDELIQYYTNADALVFPSFHEGFGMPILEAMACGCPVVTSNCYSMPEVVGDAALLVDPHDSTQIAEVIHHILTDENLRQQLIEKGRRRAQQFSWEKAADEVIAVYQRVLAVSG